MKPWNVYFFECFEMKSLICIFLTATTFCLTVNGADAEEKVSAAIFYGKLTDTDFVRIPFRSPDLESVHMIGISLRKELMELNRVAEFIPNGFFLDAEGVLAAKWGQLGDIDQNFQEAAASVNVRYDFPEQLPAVNSISFGNGLSLTSTKSEFEEELTISNGTNPLLWYMMLELDFDLPGTDQWKALCRIHHRSGIYGIFDNVDGGSNYITMGLRYHFRWD